MDYKATNAQFQHFYWCMLWYIKCISLVADSLLCNLKVEVTSLGCFWYYPVDLVRIWDVQLASLHQFIKVIAFVQGTAEPGLPRWRVWFVQAFSELAFEQGPSLQTTTPAWRWEEMKREGGSRRKWPWRTGSHQVGTHAYTNAYNSYRLLKWMSNGILINNMSIVNKCAIM